MSDDFDDLRSMFQGVACLPPDFSGFRSSLFRSNSEAHLVVAIRQLRSGHSREQVRSDLARGFPIIGAPPLSVMDLTDTPRCPVLIEDIFSNREAVPDADLDRMLALALERA